MMQPFQRQSHKMVKHTQTMPTNCLSVFDHILALALKGLKLPDRIININVFNNFFYPKIMLFYPKISDYTENK